MKILGHEKYSVYWKGGAEKYEQDLIHGLIETICS